MAETLSNADTTRGALIAAGFKLFGLQGFAGTSVRQLAAEARANVAAIAYHFGGKEGLRLACAEEFGLRMHAAASVKGLHPNPSRAESRTALREIITAIATFLLGGRGVSEMVPFMLRELAENGPCLDAVYRQFVEPTHLHLCDLLACANGTKAESAEVRLAVFTVIGQLLYFRIGQPIVARRMGWDAIGPAETEAISRRIIRNLDAMLDAEGGL